MRPNVNVTVGGPKNPTEYTYKNVVLKSNLPFAAQIGEPNCIYVIKWDFDLKGESVEIPENCVLKFEGGSLSNGTIVGQNTVIDAAPIKVFGLDVTLDGSWNIKEAYPEWFGAVGDGVTDDTSAIQKSFDLENTTVFSKKTYYVTNALFVKGSIEGNGAEIHAERNESQAPDPSHLAADLVALRYVEVKDFSVRNLSITCNWSGLALNGCSNFDINGLHIKTDYYGIILTGSGINKCEDFEIRNVHIDNNYETPHSDGIHIGKGVRNGLIDNFYGESGDDFIALNACENSYRGNTEEAGISNLVFSNCVTSKNSPLTLRVYGRESTHPIENITFNNCIFESTPAYGMYSPNPPVRFLTTNGFYNPDTVENPDQEQRNWRLFCKNIKFYNCQFRQYGEYAESIPMIGIQYTIGDISFSNCRWDDTEKNTKALFLHGNEINLNLKDSYLNGGLNTWYWSEGNNADNTINIENCIVNSNNNSGLLPINIGVRFAVGRLDTRTYEHNNKIKLKEITVLNAVNGSFYDENYQIIYIGDSVNLDYIKAKLDIDNCPRGFALISRGELDVCVSNSKDFGVHCGDPDDITGRITIEGSPLVSYENNVIFTDNDGTDCHFSGDSVYCMCPTNDAVAGSGDIKRMKALDLDAVYVVSRGEHQGTPWDTSGWKSIRKGVLPTAVRTDVANQAHFPVGHVVFDKDLGKDLTWDGDSWVEG